MTARTLVLLRHAKAEAPGEHPDFARRLSTVGESDADAVGAWLADEGLRPGLVLCSPAERTRQTWHGAAVALTQADPDAGSPEVHYEQSLYDGGRTEVMDLLRAVPEATRIVLVVGHNPTMSDMSVLLRPFDAAAGYEVLKTAGLAVHSMDGPWSQLEPGSMALVTRHTARG
ncbi:MAG: phosphohistidine phosphatase [Actinoplanes sp.]|jgi:phosphohistidine phosphatase|nr:phosphohistidine phosphatase [Actinoplanes sp.]